MTRICSCDRNASPLTSLERHCDSEGNHWGEPECGCMPGHEFRDGVCTGIYDSIVEIFSTTIVVIFYAPLPRVLVAHW